MLYRLVFTEGEGRSTCAATYPEGQGLNSSLNATNEDLAFRLVVRTPNENEMIWGCTDGNSCNFNPWPHTMMEHVRAWIATETAGEPPSGLKIVDAEAEIPDCLSGPAMVAQMLACNYVADGQQ